MELARVRILQQGSDTWVSTSNGAAVQDALSAAHIDSLAKGTVLTKNGVVCKTTDPVAEGDVIYIQRPVSLG